jgi:hypothetical protein
MIPYQNMRNLDIPYVPRFIAATGEFARMLDEYVLRAVGAEALILADAEEAIEDAAGLEMDEEELEEYVKQVTAESNARPRTPAFQAIAARDTFENTTRRLFGKVNEHSLWQVDRCSLALTDETYGRANTPQGTRRLFADCNPQGEVMLSRYGTLDIDQPVPRSISLEVSASDVQIVVNAIAQLERVNAALPGII